jgi:hypothetical protein
MAAPFISEDDLGTYLGYELVEDKATLCVEGACDLVRNRTGQAFDEVKEETITLDGSGTDAVVLPQLPVTEVIAVTDDETELEDFRLTQAGILQRTDAGVWTRGRGKVEVTYSYGYTAETVPREVRVLALTLAARLYQQGIVASETVGATSVTYSTDSLTLTAGEKAILKRYRVRHQDVAKVAAGS